MLLLYDVKSGRQVFSYDINRLPHLSGLRLTLFWRNRGRLTDDRGANMLQKRPAKILERAFRLSRSVAKSWPSRGGYHREVTSQEGT
jgi:hypothetical protein